MKTIERRPILKAFIALLVIYAFYCILLWWLGAYNFCYREQLNTFYYQGLSTVDAIELPGGLCKVTAAFFRQFFIYPVFAILVASGVLTFITILTARHIRYISGTMAYTPLAFGPALSLAFLHYNINYLYSGTIAFAVMLVAMNVMFRGNYTLRFASVNMRIFYSVVVSFFLYAACGAVAMLFGILVLISTLLHRPKVAIFYLICPLLTLVQGWISVRSGLVCDMEHAVLPMAYFTHRLPAPSIVAMPWIMIIAISIFACTFGKIKVITLKLKEELFVIFLVAALAFAIYGAKTYVQPQNEVFKELNTHIHNGEWDKVISVYHTKGTPNLIQQNCLNLALAEKGMLADSLFSQPCIDIRNIYIDSESTPYMYMLLSDIYYSMGHIALAQRYAFEANEMLDDMSPRMLQRLIDTNLIFGNYAVAEKYLNKLEHTLFYKDWATKRRAMLSDEAVNADPELGLKRKCVFPDNRFSGQKGLDDDLIQIIRTNPDHKATLQYLGCLYLLSKNLPAFAAIIDETYTDGQKLPAAYQEGIVAIGSENTDSLYHRFNIDNATIKRYEEFKAKPELHRDNFWYFQRFVE